MPCICEFAGAKIYMYYSDHKPPHFHVLYENDEAQISIMTLELIAGNIPQKKLKEVREWARSHQDELVEDWKLASMNEKVKKIAPSR
jgi:Domain of unknown function (DUF4160)